MSKMKCIIITVVDLLLIAGGSITALGQSGYFEVKIRENCQMIFTGIANGKTQHDILMEGEK